MKWKSVLALTLTLILFAWPVAGISPVQAQESLQPTTILAEENKAIQASYQTQSTASEVVISFQLDQPLAVEKISAEWEHMPADQDYVFSERTASLYELRLPKGTIPQGQTFTILLETSQKEVFHFTKLSVKQPIETSVLPTETTSSQFIETTTEAVTSSQTTVEETTSLASSSTSQANLTESSQTETSQATTTSEETKEFQLENGQYKPQLTIRSKEATGDFEISITNLPKTGIQSVQVPIWSEEKGQDDIKWYTASKQKDGSYKLSVLVSDHNYTSGKYHIHLYLQQTKGQMLGVLTTTTRVQIPKANAGLRIEKPQNGALDYFDILITDVASPAGLKSIQVPVWSEDKGQDDIKWYTATKQKDGSYKLRVHINQHNYSTGKYHIHLYFHQANGQMLGILTSTTSIQLPVPTGKLRIEPAQNGKGDGFDIIISHVSSPLGLKSIQVPVWSEDKGQDDIRWYTATKQKDGSYRVPVAIKDHKYSYNTYHVHLYYELGYGKTLGIATASTQIPAPNLVGKVQIQNLQIQHGRFDIYLSDLNVEDHVQQIIFPVWSAENGQDDLKWYPAVRQADGRFKATVSVSNHRFHFGKYEVHAYAALKNGHLYGLGATSIQVDAPNSPSLAVPYDILGYYQVILSSYHTKGSIYYAVWSEAGGQDDLRWYKANLQDNLDYSGYFNLQNHSGTGTYQVHVYENLNGAMRFINKQTVVTNHTHLRDPYFSQRDLRWINKTYDRWTFGDTGCVPASLAMIYSGLKNTTITPIEIGDYLYHHTSEFNRGIFIGTSSKGIALATKRWGLSLSPLPDKDSVAAALARGEYVICAVGPSKFIRTGSHAIVLKGYRNGQTFVRDPYYAGHNGWTSLDDLWAIRSRDHYTHINGSPFIQIGY